MRLVGLMLPHLSNGTGLNTDFHIGALVVTILIVGGNRIGV